MEQTKKIFEIIETWTYTPMHCAINLEAAVAQQNVNLLRNTCQNNVLKTRFNVGKLFMVKCRRMYRQNKKTKRIGVIERDP